MNLLDFIPYGHENAITRGASKWLLVQGTVLDGQLEVGECLTES